MQAIALSFRDLMICPELLYSRGPARLPNHICLAIRGSVQIVTFDNKLTECSAACV
jgi:hypothetical protein